MTIGYVIATGSPFDGLTLLGLYKTRDEACDVAIQDYDEGEWFVVPIEEGCDAAAERARALLASVGLRAEDRWLREIRRHEVRADDANAIVDIVKEDEAS